MLGCWCALVSAGITHRGPHGCAHVRSHGLSDVCTDRGSHGRADGSSYWIAHVGSHVGANELSDRCADGGSHRGTDSRTDSSAHGLSH